MDNSASEQTVVNIPRKAGRPVGSKKKLGLSLVERLKILEKIATSKDPDIKDTDKLGAVKLMSELLGDKIDPAERQLPLYTLRFELDSKTSNNRKQSVDKLPMDASNSLSNAILLPDPSPDMPVSVEPVIIQHTESEQDIGDTLKEDETGDLDSIF